MITINIKHTFDNFNLNINNLNLKYKTINGLVGKNGAGKTTLMNAITNNLNINGKIEININEDKILYIPSGLKAYEFLTVKEFINLLLKYNDTNISYDYIVKKLNLEEKEDELILNLSQGMSKKLSLCPIFIRTFDFLILDEPFNSIDVSYICELKDFIKELSKNATILISSHILDTLSDICDNFIVMKNGKIVKILDKNYKNLECEILECI